MQLEQVANPACLERLGFAIRVSKSKGPSRSGQAAIKELIGNDDAKARAGAFARQIAPREDPHRATACSTFLLSRTPGDPR